jgi:hypothetical protein
MMIRILWDGVIMCQLFLKDQHWRHQKRQSLNLFQILKYKQTVTSEQKNFYASKPAHPQREHLIYVLMS